MEGLLRQIQRVVFMDREVSTTSASVQTEPDGWTEAMVLAGTSSSRSGTQVADRVRTGRGAQPIAESGQLDSSHHAADRAMERYSRGDDSAFEVLYDALAPALYRFLLRKVRDPARAEDFVQQTMLQVHCARGRFVPGSRVKPWIFAIASRIFLDQVRRKKVEVLTPDADTAQGTRSDRPSPEATIEAKELEGLVRVALERLSAPQREVFELVIYAQMSHAEVAEMLGVTVASVKLRMQRANRTVRETLRLAGRAEATGTE